MDLPARFRIPGSTALVWTGVIACVAGFVLHRTWTELPWTRFGDTLLLAALSLALAAVVRRWRGWEWANALGVAWLVALTFFAGARAMLAASLVAAAALALGTLLLPRGCATRGVLALPVGLVVLGGSAGWVLAWPIHRWFVYVPLLLGLIALRAKALRETVAQARHDWQAAVAASPTDAAFAVLLLGIASIGAWLPTMQADDLAYHLALPSQLLRDGRYLADPALQIWALAPWLGDVVQGIAGVLAGREARGAVDALWMLAAAAGVGCVTAALRADARTAWLAVALFASLPLLAGLVGGMQTELPATALLLALALAVLRGGDLLAAGAVLAAGLCALKLGHAASAAVVLGWALLRARGHVDWRRLPLALALFCVLATSSYLAAWQASGNPFLPMFNHLFQSPLLPPRQLADARWHAGFGFALPWTMTFDTDRYLEGWAGGFGFVLVALAGAWLLALAQAGTRGLALAASVAFWIALLPMQYARYAFPALVLALPPLLVAATRSLDARWFGRIVLALCVSNVVFQANSNWLLRVNSVRKLVADAGRTERLYQRYAPERALIAELRRRDAGDSIVLALDPNAPAVAELGRRGRTVAWYAPTLEAARIAADADASGRRWQQLIADMQAHWLLLRPRSLEEAQRAGLALLSAQRVATAGEAELWQVPDVAVAQGELPR